MAEPQDLKAIRDLLDRVSQSVTGAGISGGAGVTSGALATTIKAIQFVIDHVESLEERIKATESK